MRSLRVMLLVCAVWASGAARAAGFDWRDVGGLDFTTPVRDQGSAGTCWAFAALGAMEAKLEITRNDPGLNPDLSEQFLAWFSPAGNMQFGFEYLALEYLQETGTVAEEEFPYTGEPFAPENMWNPEPGWEDRMFKISSYQNYLTPDTEYLKLCLETYGPLVAAMNTDNWYTPVGSAPDYPVSGSSHAVTVIGYQDDDLVPGGGYWIVKNSWGTDWGDAGYGYIRYGILESHNRVHAITGSVYQVPEPAAIVVLATCFLGLLRHGSRPRRLARTV